MAEPLLADPDGLLPQVVRDLRGVVAPRVGAHRAGASPPFRLKIMERL
nr:hypothetical protein [Micromonospora provocatoris]